MFFKPDRDKLALRKARSASMLGRPMVAASLMVAAACGRGGDGASPAEGAATASAALQVPAPDVTDKLDPVPLPPQTATCSRTVHADVVALDQVYTYNRLGSYNPVGMMYALREDVVAIRGTEPGPGNARLRTGKRPRPLTLRANVGDCLHVTFTNWLAPDQSSIPSPSESQPTVARVDDADHRTNSPYTRRASVHVQGLQYVNGVYPNDGARVGLNASSLVDPGKSIESTWYADHEGVFFMHSMGASFGGEGDGGSTVQGLFGAVNVEPAGSRWYRAQVSAETLKASTFDKNPDGTPRINYELSDAAGRPLLAILDSKNNIRHGDLDAIITGYRSTSMGTSSSKDQGHFRELTSIYHDEVKAVQAFKQLEEDPTFHSVRDGFGINYGVAGLGAELLANRAKVGPTADCQECAFEEFFLESWANGDPAMNVEKDWTGRATQALYPDDPSNVQHSYLGDPVRIRNIHAGPAETHVFHLHAHQWKYSPGEEDSNYLDSQTIGPGSAFTYDINYGGSGNRNFTVGDSIHHCHLYPHFAQGMWGLWRVHDVFESGTKDRRLPDGEIADGTPNPAVIPIPGRGMPPMPTYATTVVTDEATGKLVSRPAFPGYPFYIAGKPGHRPPQAPLDIEEDGGLPRHIVTRDVGGTTYGTGLDAFVPTHHKLNIKLLPQAGTGLEQNAMSYHGGTFPNGAAAVSLYGDAVRSYPAYTPAGAATRVLVNGRPPRAGAPFADPCPTSAPVRNYRAAYVQIDLTGINRAGWHDPQARMMVLNEDVDPTRSGKRTPEPFFFRAESGECINFYATNLIPAVLQGDDFQIAAPTDTIGQHIHLVKFDVTSADGAGNGWNYEDGTYSNEEVIHRIEAANAMGGAFPVDGTLDETGVRVTLHPKTHPLLGELGAQTTTQRWWADPLKDAAGKDRTIETVFTHDHFGPSSHQQHGFYGALIVEPTDSTWRSPTTGAIFGTRYDGGPTSWQADILTKDPANSFREFALAFADYVPAYDECGPVNPPNYKEAALPWAVEHGDKPMPEAISAADPGAMMINYRNEPITFRIADRVSCSKYQQRTGASGNMANVFRSDIHGDPYTPLLRGYEGDKVKVRLVQGSQEEQHVFSMHGHKWLREGADKDSGFVNGQAIGMSEHFEFFLTHGLPFIKSSYDTADYLYMSAPTGDLWGGMWGILRTYSDEQKGMTSLADATLMLADPRRLDIKPLPLLKLPPEAGLVRLEKDELFQVSAELDENGKEVPREIDYQLERYDELKVSYPDLVSVFDQVKKGPKPIPLDSCPANAKVRRYYVSAIDAATYLPGGRLVYNAEYDLYDPDAIIFVRDEHLAAVTSGTRQPEPLILRARAGECVQVRLTNRVRKLSKTPHWAHHSAITEHFNVNQVAPSGHVSLHPQLVHLDVNTDDGANVGLNVPQTVPPGTTRIYRWYAGDYFSAPKTWLSPRATALPMEYGVVNLRNMADVVNHGMHGSIGALIIEPPNATWDIDAGTEAQARVKFTNNKGVVEQFREFVVLYQDDLGLHTGKPQFQDDPWSGLNSGTAVRNIAGIDDSQDTGMKAFNYRTEPLWARLGVPSQTSPETTNQYEMGDILSSYVHGDPATPIFRAKAGEAMRLRVAHPSGHARQHVFVLHGAEWRRNPWEYNQSSAVMGSNPYSPVVASQGGASVAQSWNINPLYGAGGRSNLRGDYLYRDQASFQWSGGGLWGVVRVE